MTYPTPRQRMTALPANPPPHGTALDYASPPARRRRQVFSVVTCVALAIPAFVLTTLLGPLAMRFGVFFYDYGVALPGVTVLMLDFGNLFRKGLWIGMWLAVILIPFGVAPLLGDEEESPRRRIYSRLVMLLSFGVTIGLIVLAIFALFMPVVNLMNAMSK